MRRKAAVTVFLIFAAVPMFFFTNMTYHVGQDAPKAPSEIYLIAGANEYELRYIFDELKEKDDGEWVYEARVYDPDGNFLRDEEVDKETHDLVVAESRSIVSQSKKYRYYSGKVLQAVGPLNCQLELQSCSKSQ